MEYVIIFLVLVVLMRNFRKDKSDGRDYLGGGGTKKTPTKKLL